jgi:hypothetical protein
MDREGREAAFEIEWRGMVNGERFVPISVYLAWAVEL